jgi:hypothetical protein
MWKHPAGVIAAFIMFAAVSAPVSAQLQLYGFLPPLTQKDIALIREKTDDFGNRPAGTVATPAPSPCCRPSRTRIVLANRSFTFSTSRVKRARETTRSSGAK